MAVTALIPPQYRLLAAGIAALALAGAGFAAGWTFQSWKSSAVLAEVQAAHAEQIRQAVKAERDGLASVLTEERALRTQSEGIAHETRQRLDAVDTAAAGLAGERNRLRDELRRHAAASACATGAASSFAAGSGAGPAAGVVSGGGIHDMLDEGAAALEVLAPALERAREKFIGCRDTYNQARERLARMGAAGRTIEATQ